MWRPTCFRRLSTMRWRRRCWITDSEQLALEVQQELPRQLAALGRAEIAGRSIDDYGTILLCDLDRAGH